MFDSLKECGLLLETECLSRRKVFVWVMSVVVRGALVRQYSVSQVWHFLVMTNSRVLFEERKATVWVHSFLSPLRPSDFSVPRGLTSENSTFCLQRVPLMVMDLRTKRDHFPVVL
jgi:hypothetical protein